MDTTLNPTGASSIWTSNDSVITKARELYHAGSLREAEELLAAPVVRDTPAARELRDLIGRLRFEYSQSATTLGEKLRTEIPDFSPADLAGWIEGGQIETRRLDGQAMIFRREPANLFRFCADAVRRRANTPSKLKSLEQLQETIREAKSTGKVEVNPRRYHLRYTMRVQGGLPAMKAGSTLRVWLPMPQEYRQQKNVRVISTEPSGGAAAPNGSAHRTIYLEKRVTDPLAEQIFTAEYEFTVYSYYPQLSDAAVQPLPSDFPREYLSERLPHIPLSPAIRNLAAEITARQSNPLAAARAIFNWIDRNIAYHAENEYCLIPSIGEKVLSVRRGDCGVQGMAFIMLCRAAGIPARWQSGWRLAPNAPNMHDWAEFYVAPWGWLPADPSDGPQASDDPDVRDFYLGHNDSNRMIVNLDYGQPLTPPKHSLRSEPADFQRGEVEIDGINLYYNQWDYQMELLPVENAKPK